MAAIKERPILFSAPMVRAILDGQKTQTRRVVKPRGRNSLFAVEADGSPAWSDSYILDPGNDEWRMRDCPYGQLGDRLWVRETVACGACAPGKPSHWSPSFWRREQGTPSNPNGLWYAADGLAPERPITERGKWTPAIHMPRWASRILLEIASVRVERLNDCSEADALAEGVRETSLGDLHMIGPDGCGALPRAAAPPLVLWEFLWRNINGDTSWEANPWVWVVEFKRISAFYQNGSMPDRLMLEGPR